MTRDRTRPAPLATEWDWQMRGACRGMGVEVFFHPENERGEQRRRRELRAQLLCAECPVATPCRDYALRTRQQYGVWGGLTEAARMELLKAHDLDDAPA